MPAKKRTTADAIVDSSRRLSNECDALCFGGKVEYIYNPLVYARANWEQYILRYGGRRGVALLLGMNPGPWGMAQTGVPFGEVAAVRDWLALDEPIHKPDREHPKRPITGLSCHRSEVSGARLWGWARDRFANANVFFDSFFVWNYCPLSFMVESGANLTPDKLSTAERNALYATCDRALGDVVRLIAPSMVVGVGKFAEKRAAKALTSIDVAIATVLHPSPASPIANRGWAAQADTQLRELGLLS